MTAATSTDADRSTGAGAAARRGRRAGARRGRGGDRGRRPGGRPGPAPRDARAAPVGDGHGLGRGHPHGARCGSWPTVATVVLLGLVVARRADRGGPRPGPRRRARAARRRPPPSSATRCGAIARRCERSRPPAPRWTRPTHGVLIMNLRSGGGKAERFALVEECRRRGIEPVVLQPGDDLLELARSAIDRGADVIGMAGGDGSQALVGQRGDGGRRAAGLRPGRHPQPLRPRPRPRPQRRRRRARRLRRGGRAAHRPRRGERAGLRQQRVPRRVRQDRPVAGVPRRQAPDDHGDAVRAASVPAPSRSTSTSSAPTAAVATAPRSSRCPTTPTC